MEDWAFGLFVVLLKSLLEVDCKNLVDQRMKSCLKGLFYSFYLWISKSVSIITLDIQVERIYLFRYVAGIWNEFSFLFMINSILSIKKPGVHLIYMCSVNVLHYKHILQFHFSHPSSDTYNSGTLIIANFGKSLVLVYHNLFDSLEYSFLHWTITF